MKITQEIRDAAGKLHDEVQMVDVEAEMAEKAREFRESGSEIYQRV